MKLEWQPSHDGGWQAIDKTTGLTYVHIGPRGTDDIWDMSKTARYCVFGEASYAHYCGDLPVDMPLEQMQAVAIAMWRLR